VIALMPPLNEVVARVQAVIEFGKLPEAAPLAAANKRIGNILKKAAAGATSIDSSLLIETAEKSLAKAVAAMRPGVQARFTAGDYAGALQVLAQAKDAVDAFFNEVMVMAEDAKLRDNRIALLRDLHGLMNQVADISRLAA
jgi:glycyl-tRNA synthetase beta chain